MLNKTLLISVPLGENLERREKVSKVFGFSSIFSILLCSFVKIFLVL